MKHLSIFESVIVLTDDIYYCFMMQSTSPRESWAGCLAVPLNKFNSRSRMRLPEENLNDCQTIVIMDNITIESIHNKCISLEKENKALKKRLRALERKVNDGNDYPFSSWETYGRALASICCGVRDEYPIYEETNDQIIIIEEMLEDGFDAQEGFDTFITSVIKGARYGFELFISEISSGYVILSIFKKKGVKFDPEPLFSFNKSDCFEDDVADFVTRALILDAIVEVWGDDWGYYLVEPYGDWKNIEGKYWEDMTEEESEGPKGYQMAFKHYSKYLSSL